MKINSEVLDKDKELLQESQVVAQELNELSLTVKAKRQQDYLWNIIPTKEEKRDKKEKKIRKKKGATYEITKQMINEKKDFSEIAKERGIIKGTVIGHVEKLLARGDELNLSYIKFSEEKLIKIKKAFIQSEVFALTPVFEALKGKFSYDELKLARVLLRAKGEV